MYYSLNLRFNPSATDGKFLPPGNNSQQWWSATDPNGPWTPLNYDDTPILVGNQDHVRVAVCDDSKTLPNNAVQLYAIFGRYLQANNPATVASPVLPYCILQNANVWVDPSGYTW